MAGDNKAHNSEYFVFGNPILCAFVAVGFYFLGLAICCPENVPSVLGPFGDHIKFLGKSYSTQLIYLFVAAVVIHIFESMYAYSLCRKYKLSSESTVKWVLQTFLFGYPSLRELRKYGRRQKNRANSKKLN